MVANIARKMYQSSLFNGEKRLFQETKKKKFFHISAVRVQTGVLAYMDATLLGSMEIHC